MSTDPLKVKAITIPWYPYLRVSDCRHKQTSENFKISGVFAEYMTITSQILNLTIIIDLQLDGNWGNLHHNNDNLTGIIGKLINNDEDNDIALSSGNQIYLGMNSWIWYQFFPISRFHNTVTSLKNDFFFALNFCILGIYIYHKF